MARFRSDKHRRAVMAALNNGNRRSSNNKVGLSQVRSKKRTPGKSLDVTPYLQRIKHDDIGDDARLKKEALIKRLNQRKSRKEGQKEIQNIHYNTIKRGILIKKSDDPHITDIRIFIKGIEAGFSHTYMLNMMKKRETYKDNKGEYMRDKHRYIKQ